MTGVWELRYPEDVILTIERGGETYSLSQGEKVTLKNGANLVFYEVTLWTNYVIYYNPAGWILAVLGLAGFVTLLIHFMPGFVKELAV